MDGVVRSPSLFSMTFGVLPSMTATQEFVVPRSMPITFPMSVLRIQQEFNQLQEKWGRTAPFQAALRYFFVPFSPVSSGSVATMTRAGRNNRPFSK